MSPQLLNEAMLLFPALESGSRIDTADWCESIERLRLHVLSLAPADRFELFATAQDQIRTADFHDLQTMPLWFFSHPSQAVFEEFVAHTDACRSFADYSECVSRARLRDRHNLISRKRLKKLQKVVKRQGRLFPLRYGEILRAHKGGEVAYIYAHKHERHLWLTPITRKYLEKEGNKIRDQLLRDAIRARLKKNQTGWQYEPDAVLVRIFETDALIRQSSLYTDQLVSSAEVLKFKPRIPLGCKPIGGVENVVARALNIGMWPKWNPEESHVVQITGASDFRYRLNQSLVEELSRAYLEECRQQHGRFRQVKHGLLPIGLKIHCVSKNPPGANFLVTGGFRMHNAGTCFNVPPVGNIEHIRALLSSLQQMTRVSYLNNPDYQIQVCSPGELSPRHAALLGIGFYLGADPIRRYKIEEFVTSHWQKGGRLIIYGAGVMDGNFDWWNKTPDGRVRIEPLSVVLKNRTDVLTCKSVRDIENVNLMATLLMHAQYGGYWKDLGGQFMGDMEALLHQHELSGILNVLWVKAYSGQVFTVPADAPFDESDEAFAQALEELMGYAYGEVARITHARNSGNSAGEQGILFEMQEMLRHYRTEIEFRSPQKGEEI